MNCGISTRGVDTEDIPIETGVRVFTFKTQTVIIATDITHITSTLALTTATVMITLLSWKILIPTTAMVLAELFDIVSLSNKVVAVVARVAVAILVVRIGFVVDVLAILVVKTVTMSVDICAAFRFAVLVVFILVVLLTAVAKVVFALATVRLLLVSIVVVLVMRAFVIDTAVLYVGSVVPAIVATARVSVTLAMAAVILL